MLTCTALQSIAALAGTCLRVLYRNDGSIPLGRLTGLNQRHPRKPSSITAIYRGICA